MSGFAGKRVLVTGGGSGIGRGVARAFAQMGADVTVAGRRLEALEETSMGRMTVRQADVTDEAAVADLFDRPYDIVVANAGGGQAAKLVDTSLDAWNQTLAVTLTGVFLTFREGLREMPKGGRLIAIGSTASLKGGANISAYVAAKHGVLGLVRSVAHEVAKKGITCNAVCPGFVDTDMAATASKGVQARLGITAEEAEAMLVASNPIGRLISVDEVVHAVLYLASPEAAMVNGHALSLSGGEI